MGGCPTTLAVRITARLASRLVTNGPEANRKQASPISCASTGRPPAYSVIGSRPAASKVIPARPKAAR